MDEIFNLGGTEVPQTVMNEGATVTSTSSSEPSVGELNKLSLEAFQEAYIDPNWMLVSPPASHQERRSSQLRISYRTPHTMDPIEVEACFNLIKQTSQSDYESSSMGWHPRRKLREMNDKDMRYLLVSSSTPEHTSDCVEKPLLGFLSMMITHDSIPAVPVLYIYEIHLEEFLRHQGIGRHLLGMAECMAHAMDLHKVMLTCFVSNHKARSFYERYGFVIDDCSPRERQTRRKTSPPDYIILSKVPSVSAVLEK